MRRIVAWTRQHDLGIGGQFDFAGPQSIIGDRHPPDLAVVLRRYDDIEPRRQGAIETYDLDAIFGERDFVIVRLGTARLKTRRPHRAVVDVPQIHIGPPRIAGDILLPARHGEIPPAAVARSG